MFRCVQSNNSSEVIAFGLDENQAGEPFGDIGVWCDFTIENIPDPTPELLALEGRPNLYKVVGSTIQFRTIEEIQRS